ncbi:MAG: hypothetical protein IJ484_09330 [Oscillospiraceae bacterium]|nr:hypothetical protein [Oscillospiraceae bacterium]
MMDRILTAHIHGRTLRCTLRVSPGFCARLTADCPLLPEAAAYGACRLIARSARLQAALVPVSYGLRFAKRRRAQRLWLQMPGRALGLRGTVYLNLTADPDGLTLQEICLRPEGAPPPCPRVQVTAL